MKRTIVWTLVLLIGAGLGIGGTYVAFNWKDLNPFEPHAIQGHSRETLFKRLQQSCMIDKDLHGSAVRLVETTDNKLMVRGWIGDNKQKAKLEELARGLLAESPDLAKKCPDGVASTLTLFPIDKHLMQLQHDFDETRDANKDEDALKRSVMRTTRLDKAAFTEHAALRVDAVCIRGANKKEATAATLKAAIEARLQASGLAPELVPTIELDVRYFTSPALLLQAQLSRSDTAKDVRITAAWYDGLGKLHIDGVVRRAEQRPLVNKALDAILGDGSNLAMFRSTASKEEKIDIELNFVALEEPGELQRRLVERARKEQKPLQRSFRIVGFTVEPLMEGKTPVVDDEGNPSSVFRVVCHSLLGKHPARDKAESELVQWLSTEMPPVMNADQRPIRPEIDFRTRQSPAIALQERLIERELDGAVVTDALYDETGTLELFGRLSQPGQTPDAAFKDLLADDGPWTAKSMTAHLTRKDGMPIAWTDVVRAARTKLAAEDAGKRLRLDRLYYRYEKDRLHLVADGTLLTGGKDDPAQTITRAVDGILGSRGDAPVSLSALKMIDNPVFDLQNLAADRPELDGVLLMQARYDADRVLHLDGSLGQRGQQSILAALVLDRLNKIPGILRKDRDPKAWSIDGMKLHASARGDVPWSEVVQGCQAELAGDLASRRAVIERMRFHYDPKTLKPALLWHGTWLARPAEKPDEPGLSAKIAGGCKTLLPDLPAHGVEAALTKANTPIYALQQLAGKDKLDGMLFADAYFDREGKLILEGKRGSEEQLKDVKILLDKVLTDAKPPIAPAGVGPLDRMIVVPWQPLLADIRTQFAQGDAFHKQTRIDRVFFQHDDATKKTVIHVEGLCIYQGKKLTDEAQSAVLLGIVQKQLGAKGIDNFAINLRGIERKPDPAPEMQNRANDAGIDGIVFSIGFDAKGVCYVQAPFIPKGHEENVRKLLEEYSKKHPHLGPLQLR